MRKLIQFIAATLFFYSSTQAQYISDFNTDFSKMRIYGRVKSITEYYSPGTYIIYTFNSNKKLLTAKLTGFSIGRHEFQYNAKGNMNEWKVYNTDGSLQFKLLYKLDLMGNRIEEEHYNQQGELLTKRINSYDENGNKIQTIDYGYEKENLKMYKSSIRIYTYDTKGNAIQEKYKIYTYDSNGNITNDNNDYSRVYDRKFDSKDNMIEMRTNSEEGGVNYSYTYDKFGNWIKSSLKFETSKYVRSVQRKITYY